MAEIVNGNKQNEVNPHIPKSRSKFNLSYPFINTLRFAEYSPHVVYDGVPDDKKVTLNCGHDIRTFSFKAPLMQDIRIFKDYFLVPREAILPINWQKIYVNPKRGDDVTAGNVNSVYHSFYTSLYQIFSDWRDFITDTNHTLLIEEAIRFMLAMELFFSRGCLLSTLGVRPNVRLCHNSDVNAGNGYASFDKACDVFWEMIAQHISTSSSQSQQFDLQRAPYNSLFTVDYRSDQVLNTYRITLRGLIDKLRAAPWALVEVPNWSWHSGEQATFKTFISKFAWSVSENDVDLAFPASYQMICAHYYSNDNIDNIYSAELYRSSMKYLIQDLLFKAGVFASNDRWYKFTWNGVYYDYDVFSKYVWSQLFQTALANGFVGQDPVVLQAWLKVVSGLFSYKHTLRYQDYFTGARVQPLAVGNVNVNVNSGSPNYVNIIDITRNIQRQRMLNAVLRMPQQIEGYISELFHTKVQPDYHNPFWLASTKDKVYAVEVENTGDAQQSDPNSVTAVLKSNADKYSFEIDIDRPCIILGITHFDITRFYNDGIDRMHSHIDRFDMFNPFMQYIGDQDIAESELDSSRSVGNPFAYTTRHMEYKQNKPICAGGVTEFLPGYAFVAESPRKYVDATGGLNSVFIRAFNHELDQFYLSLTGYSLASYFHFIVKTNNELSSSRPMSYSPNIL